MSGKAVLFATGPADHAAQVAAELCATLGAPAVRVVAPAGTAAEIRTALCSGVEVLPARTASLPALLLRLWLFLAFSPAQVSCLSDGHGYRSLKLAAFALRGTVVFVRRTDRAALSLFRFSWLSVSRLWARANGAVLVGSASGATLSRLEADLRRRRPGSEVVVVRTAGDWLRAAAHWKRFRYLSIPWTAEGHELLKLSAWLLPCGRREIYNEHGDSFSVRRAGVLLQHVVRRRPPGVTVLGSASASHLAGIVADLRRRYPGEPIHGVLRPRLMAAAGLFDSVTELRILSLRCWRQLLGRAFSRGRTAWYAIPCTNEGQDALKLWGLFLPLGQRLIYNENHDLYRFRQMPMLVRHLFWRLPIYARQWWRALVSLPQGVTVLGTASGFFLQDIVGELRRRHPGEPIHGLLPEKLVAPAAALFDSFTVLRPFSPVVWREIVHRAFGRRRTGWYVIPCTNEGYYRWKLLGWLLPMGRRQVFNENHDGYLLRQWPMLARHLRWRLEHRMFYQGLTQRRGRAWPVVAIHLLLYPARLAAGAALLAWVLLRAWWKRRWMPALVHAPPVSAAVGQPQPVAPASACAPGSSTPTGSGV